MSDCARVWRLLSTWRSRWCEQLPGAVCGAVCVRVAWCGIGNVPMGMAPMWRPCYATCVLYALLVDKTKLAPRATHSARSIFSSIDFPIAFPVVVEPPPIANACANVSAMLRGNFRVELPHDINYNSMHVPPLMPPVFSSDKPTSNFSTRQAADHP